MDEFIQMSEINHLLRPHGIASESIERLRSGARFATFRIGDRFLLKLSTDSLSEEVAKLLRVKELPKASNLKHTGSYEGKTGTFSYLITDYSPGEDLFQASSHLSLDQQRAIGKEIADFLSGLHSICGRCPDIGHYVPTIPCYYGSWREGHTAYIDYLGNRITSVELKDRNRKVISDALVFMKSNINSLDYQDGPVLLHNDLHPKNIIVHDGALSGIVDWECSQFGEADFDLCHIMHWWIFPPSDSGDLSAFVKSLLDHSGLRESIFRLCTRLSIYQIEHDLNQLIWNNGNAEYERCTRIVEWMEGRIYSRLSRLVVLPISN